MDQISTNSIPQPIVAPPIISQNKTYASSNLALTKVLLGIIPLLIFTATGIISYSLVNNAKQTATYQSSAKEISETPNINGKMLPLASDSGCIFSLRYDATESASLKTDALSEINKIKSRIENNENPENLMFEVKNGMTKEESATKQKEYYTDRSAYLTKYKNLVSPFAKFQVNASPNFCFQNTKEINNTLGEIFYSVNPNFMTEFNSVLPKTISKPFEINKSSESGTIDYGWMIIKK